MPGMELGIDLGTSQVTIYVAGRGVVLREPAVIAVDEKSGRLLACGREAYDMLGRTPDSILAIRPLAKGVISEYDYAEKMLRYFVRQVCAYKIIKPRAAVSVPACVTEVEQRSLIEAAHAAGVRRVVLVEEAVAAALGADVEVSAPFGNMIVNIGGGTTDVAVLSLKGISFSASARVGGDDMDTAIVRYLRSKYNLIVGQRTAEKVKITIGSALPQTEETGMSVCGRNAVTGLPVTQWVTSLEIHASFSEQLLEITQNISRVLENTPPELVGDILHSGILLTGGGALLHGIETFLETKTGVACRTAKNPADCVAIGAGKAVKYADIMSAGVYDVEQFSYHLSDTLTN